MGADLMDMAVSGSRNTMADHDMHDVEFWHRGKVTRRRLFGYGAAAGALGATMLVPAPWQSAFGQAKPYKVGTLQPLSGAAAAGGNTALVGTQMAVTASTSPAASTAVRSS